MNIFKTELAPIPARAWEQIREEAIRALRANLSARKIVDVVGPQGFDFSAVSSGRLEIPASEPKPHYGVREVFPLLEPRFVFELDVWELDNAERGARDLELAGLISAAKQIAGFEESAVYKGFPAARIPGMSEAAHRQGGPLTIGKDVSEYLDAVIQAKLRLEGREVEGPYGLVLGPEPYRILYGTATGYPVWKQVEEFLGEKVHLSPFIEGGFLVSKRGGDLELILGQDFTLGYEACELRKVRLYFTETFTFRILDPRVIVEFSMRR